MEATQYFKKTWQLLDTYLIAKWQSRVSTASFWYLPEPPNIKHKQDLDNYKNSKPSPFYLLNYEAKLAYPLVNKDNIIVLPYPAPIGQQVNPEAAFQYALGLHDRYYRTQNINDLNQFYYYANYFLNRQSEEGLFEYQFDWYEAKSPWYSALAQARGASVMLRAWQSTGDEKYILAAKKAVSKFATPTSQGGFLHPFSRKHCFYFEEYPNIPTGVINGFMSSLMNIWELQYWTKDPEIKKLWEMGLASLEQMLPFYSNGWWSLYDLDDRSPLANVNSPRYHLLEIHYLEILSVLSESSVVAEQYNIRVKQLKSKIKKFKALSMKTIRKILYR